MTWTLTASSPFSLDAVVDSHGWVQLHPFQRDPDRPGFGYALRLRASARTVSAWIAPAEQGIHLLVDDELTPPEVEELQQTAAWMTGLGLDLRPFYEQARREPRLAHVEAGAKGRLLRSATVYEDVVKTILTTNTTWAGTRRMNEMLVNLYGAPSASGEKAFPTPTQLAGLDPEELRVAARLGYRATYVVELSQAVAAGNLDLESLKSPDLPTEEVRKILLGIKGVGDYAAANMLLLLGHYDFVPVDSQAVSSVGQAWHNGERIGPKEVYAAFEAWRPYRGLAYWFWEWD
jgi:3-methyladenine DNA glycosylase/8-oxoguanine DNA glycosylase